MSEYKYTYTIRASTRITDTDATIDEIWAIILDFTEYSAWNKYIRDIVIGRNPRHYEPQRPLQQNDEFGMKYSVPPGSLPWVGENNLWGLRVTFLDNENHIMDWSVPHAHPNFISSWYRMKLHSTESDIIFTLERNYTGFLRWFGPSRHLLRCLDEFGQNLKKRIYDLRRERAWQREQAEEEKEKERKRQKRMRRKRRHKDSNQ